MQITKNKITKETIELGSEFGADIEMTVMISEADDELLQKIREEISNTEKRMEGILREYCADS